MLNNFVIFFCFTLTTAFMGSFLCNLPKNININRKHHKINMNTLLNNVDLPKFKSFKSEQVETDIKIILDNLEKDFNEIENKLESEDNLDEIYKLAVEEIQKIEYPLSFGWGIVSHLNSVKNNEQIRKSYEKMQPEVIKYQIKYHNLKFYMMD